MNSSKMSISSKTEEKLREFSKLRVTEETWQLNAIPDLKSGSVLEGKRVIKDTG